MQDWDKVLARATKEKINKAKSQAVAEGSAFIGTIEQVAPLVISILDGAIMYDEEDLFLSNTYVQTNDKLKVPGARVLVVPIDTLETICLIDLVK